MTEALGEVDRLKEVERGLKSEQSLVKSDKATLLSSVEELEAAQHSADQQQERPPDRLRQKRPPDRLSHKRPPDSLRQKSPPDVQQRLPSSNRQQRSTD